MIFFEGFSSEKILQKNPANDFFHKARGLVNEVHLIGDAKVPRNIHDAMHEGYQIGLDI